MENMKRRVLDRMTCVLPPGHYDTPHKLIRTLNTCILSKVVQLWAQTENVGFHYSDTGNKVIFETMRLKTASDGPGMVQRCCASICVTTFSWVWVSSETKRSWKQNAG